MRLTLTAHQQRVLAVLIEKSRTTPEQYPLTVNSLLAGCNQKSSRNPVTSLTEGDVVHALQELTHMRFVKMSATPRGARSNRYEHDITSQLPWSPKEQAVLAELMLRGPQTPGELRTRSDRMVSMPDLQDVQNMLDTFAANDPPEVVNVGRAPGQSAVRYRHNFYPEGEEPDVSSPAPPPPRASSPSPDWSARLDDLDARVTALESKLQSLGGM